MPEAPADHDELQEVVTNLSAATAALRHQARRRLQNLAGKKRHVPPGIADTLWRSAKSDAYELDERRDCIRLLRAVGGSAAGRAELLPLLFSPEFPTELAADVAVLCADDMAGLDAMTALLAIVSPWSRDVESFVKRADPALACLCEHLDPPAAGLDDGRGKAALNAAVRFAQFRPLHDLIDRIHYAVEGKHFNFPQIDDTVPRPPSANDQSQAAGRSATESKGFWAFAKDLANAPLRFLPEAMRRVPAVKYALASLAVAGCVAVAMSYFKSPQLALVGTIIGIAVMGVMVTAARAASARKAHVLPATVFIWACLVLFIVWAIGMTTSVFIGWPLKVSLFRETHAAIVPKQEPMTPSLPSTGPLAPAPDAGAAPISSQPQALPVRGPGSESRGRASNQEPCKLTAQDQGRLSIAEGMRTSGLACDGFEPGAEVEVTFIGEVEADSQFTGVTNIPDSFLADVALEDAPGSCALPSSYDLVPPCLATTAGINVKNPWPIRMQMFTKADAGGRATVLLHAYRCHWGINGSALVGRPSTCKVAHYTLTMKSPGAPRSKGATRSTKSLPSGKPSTEPPVEAAPQQPAAKDLKDGQQFVLTKELSAFAGHSVRLVVVGNDPDADVLFKQLGDVFAKAGWRVARVTIAMLADRSVPQFSFISADKIDAPLTKAVFRILRESGVSLPLVPDATMGSVPNQADPELVVVIR